MSKISELTDGGSLLPTDSLIAVRSGANVKVKADTINVDQIDLGDNEKIRLGDSQDLQIYHDAFNSYIDDAGAGSLLIRGTNLQLRSYTTNENFLSGTENGAVSVFYDGLVKLATTSTGIDVTGSVVADVLGVQNDSASITIENDASNRNQRLRRNSSNSIILDKYNGTTTTNTAKFDENGDISFYDSTGVSQSLFWDSSAESLGIGTTSPNTLLHIKGPNISGYGAMTIEGNADEVDPRLSFYGFSTTAGTTRNYTLDIFSDVSEKGARYDVPSGYYQSWTVAGAKKMTLDASGNVGIGVTPSAWGSGTNTALQIRSSAFVQQDSATNVGLGRNAVQSGTWSYIANGYAQMLNLESDGAFKFFQAGSGTAGNTVSFSQAMTLDASGNLLVGTTNTDPVGANVTGAEIANIGVASFSRENGVVLYVNRKGTAGTENGEIINVRSNGTSVGSIGASGGTIYAGQGGSGLIFNDGGTKDLIPYSLNAADTVDNSISLGISSKRFKDLYLSGGVYVGGTGAANYLDDYETGTWTPVISGTTTTGAGTYTRQSGVYVKVGDLVYASCTLGISAHTGAGDAEVSGLPFQALNNVANYAGISVSFNNGYTTTSGYQIIGFVQINSSYIRLYETGGTGQQNALALDTSFTEFDFSIVYRST